MARATRAGAASPCTGHAHQHDVGREARPERRQHVVAGGAVGARDQADAARQHRQGALALRRPAGPRRRARARSSSTRARSSPSPASSSRSTRIETWPRRAPELDAPVGLHERRRWPGGSRRRSKTHAVHRRVDDVLAAQREAHLAARRAQVLHLGLDPERAQPLEHRRQPPGDLLDREDPAIADEPHGVRASTISPARAPLDDRALDRGVRREIARQHAGSRPRSAGRAARAARPPPAGTGRTRARRRRSAPPGRPSRSAAPTAPRRRRRRRSGRPRCRPPW